MLKPNTLISRVACLTVIAVYNLFTFLPQCGYAQIAQPSPETASWRIEMTGDAYSLWATDVERSKILNEIAMLSGAAVGGGDGVEGRVTLTVTNASVEELLARLLQNTALVFTYDQANNRYRIANIQGFRSGGPDGFSG